MNDWPVQIITDFPIISLVLLIVSGFSIFAIWRLTSQCNRLKKDLYLLQNEFRAMNSGHLGMGREISRVTSELADVENRQEQTQQSGPTAKIYEQAGLLLSRGASIEEVVESCEITSAEAELLAIMRHSAPTSYQSKSQISA